MTTITREQAKDLRNAFECWQQDYDPAADKEQYEMFGLGVVAMDVLLASLGAGSDSNSHLASGPLSNDRLHRIREILGKAAAQSDGGNLGYAMSDAVKAFDELLEVRKAEPVFFIEIEGDDWIQAGRIPGSTFDFNELPDGIVKLYAATPAPVVPEEATPDNIEILASARVDSVVFQWDEDQRNAAADSWNACRPALRTGGKS